MELMVFVLKSVDQNVLIIYLFMLKNNFMGLRTAKLRNANIFMTLSLGEHMHKIISSP